MTQKLEKALLVLSLMVPLHVQGAKNLETLCNLYVTKCLRVGGNGVVDGNLTVNGTLTADGVNLSALAGLAGTIGATGATGAPGTGGLGTLVSSVIPFSSGLGTGAAVVSLAGGLATTGLVMGFGANALLATLTDPVSLTATLGSFAFTVPQAGTLHNLWGSVDANVLVTGAGTGTYYFAYTIYHSSAVNGATIPYTATALSAIVPLTAPAVAPALTTGFGNNTTTSLTVAAGDRIVLEVTPVSSLGLPLALPITILGNAGFQAGVIYTPS